jgi:hypothetical protein
MKELFWISLGLALLWFAGGYAFALLIGEPENALTIGALCGGAAGLLTFFVMCLVASGARGDARK